METTTTATTAETGTQPPRCAECQAPLEDAQRYCVVCGARHVAADNPAARYLSDAASRRRQPTGGESPRRAGVGIGVAALLAALPLAAGVGVIVGRSGNSSDHDLVAALRAQTTAVVNVGGDAATATTPAASGAEGPATPSGDASPDGPGSAPASDFPLDSGFTIVLRTLPLAGADQAAAADAVAGARASGADAPGIIAPNAFTTTPDEGADRLVVYSGAYRDRADAQAALARLSRAFPDATVVAVRAQSARQQ